MQTNPGFQKSPYIQWLRGIAAMAVVVFHASVYLARDTGNDSFSAVFGGIFGLLGVAVFFAISGALMADLARRSGPDLFLAHRLARIYPAFALVFLTVSMLNTGALHGDVRALSLGLVGRRADYVLGIEWTLVAEVFFYVLLYGLCTLRLTRWLEAFACLWLGAIVATTSLTYASADGTLFPTLSQVLLLPANASFAGGLLIPAIIRQTGFSPALGALAIGCVVSAIFVDLDLARLPGAVAAVIIVGLAFQRSPPKPTTSVFGRALERMGDWSYGLYLCHVPVILLVYRLLPAAPPPLLWFLAVGSAVAISIPVGMLDVWLYRRLRRRVNGLRPLALAIFARGYFLAYLALGIIFLFKQH